LAVFPLLQILVAEKLKCQWSPKQISGWLKAEHPRERTVQVSHATIYKSLYVQARGVLKKELMVHLRSRRIMSCGKTSSKGDQTRGQIIDAISIRDHLAEIEDRASPGHWEGDLLSGAKNTHIATLVERISQFVMLVQLGGKDSQTVVDALVRKVRKLPKGLMAALTRIGALKWPTIKRSPSRRMLGFTSLILNAHGNAEAMKIPMACCAIIFQLALIFRFTAKMSLIT
jgi:IS30 family transposase